MESGAQAHRGPRLYEVSPGHAPPASSLLQELVLCSLWPDRFLHSLLQTQLAFIVWPSAWVKVLGSVLLGISLSLPTRDPQGIYLQNFPTCQILTQWIIEQVSCYLKASVLDRLRVMLKNHFFYFRIMSFNNCDTSVIYYHACLIF